MASEPLKDKDYDLISVVYHASQACETCDTYAQDAKRAGDDDVARFFEDVHQQNKQLIEKGKSLLRDRI